MTSLPSSNFNPTAPPDAPEDLYFYEMEAPVTHPPHRVVSLVPAVTESLCELDLSDRLVGITDDALFPAAQVARIAKVGTSREFDHTLIAAFRPDLIIVNRDENRREDIDALRASGVPVWITGPRTVREAFNLLWTIMHVFNVTTAVERVRSAEWVLDWLERMDESRTVPCRVFLAASLNPLTTYPADHFAVNMLTVCGGSTIFPEAIASPETPYPLVTMEAVEQANPDILLLPDTPDSDALARLAKLNLPDLQARIRRVDPTLLTWHGTRMARAMSLIPDLLCELSNAVSPEA